MLFKNVKMDALVYSNWRIEQCHVREEQQQHQEQLAKFLVQFQEEVCKIEKLQQAQAVEDQMTLGAVGGVEEPKSFKPPTLLPFSRADQCLRMRLPVSKVWQAK